MTEVEEQATYSFSELNDSAKTAARNQFRDTGGILDYEWWDHTYEDAVRMAGLLGISIGTTRRATNKGESYEVTDIYFSGFSSQGDGACFAGTYISTDADLDKLKAEAPEDTVLHSIADQLALLQVTQRLATGRTRMELRIRAEGHYSHSGTMRVEDIYDIFTDDEIDLTDELLAVFRRFADWIYARLEEEHDYLLSDECIDQYLAELTFDSDGSEV
jgi:hypothetical protein